MKTPTSTGATVTTRYRPPYMTPNMTTGRSTTRQRASRNPLPPPVVSYPNKPPRRTQKSGY